MAVTLRALSVYATEGRVRMIGDAGVGATLK
jgi:hypothetical protein